MLRGFRSASQQSPATKSIDSRAHFRPLSTVARYAQATPLWRRERLCNLGIGDPLVGERKRAARVHVLQEIQIRDELRDLRIHLPEIRKRYDAILVNIPQ